jgi:hypothetical protein
MRYDRVVQLPAYARELWKPNRYKCSMGDAGRRDRGLSRGRC